MKEKEVVERYRKIVDIDLEKLAEGGYEYLLLDLDGTLTMLGIFLRERVEEWIQEAKEKGFKINLCTNNVVIRLKILRQLGIKRENIKLFACKPSKSAYVFSDKEQEFIEPAKVVMISNTMIDLWGAKRAKIGKRIKIDSKIEDTEKLKRTIKGYVTNSSARYQEKRENRKKNQQNKKKKGKEGNDLEK
ncbi:MAG: HAD family hydrolase [Clostridia bacterium]